MDRDRASEQLSGRNARLEIEGREDEGTVLADYNQVAPDFFTALDIPIIEGRTFTATEARSGLAVIVSESLARRLWPNGGAVGSRINSNPRERVWREVVGVARDIRSRSLQGAPSELVYYPMAELPFSGTAYGSLIVKMDGDPAMAVSIIRDRLRALDPALPISRVATMRELRARSVETTRFLVGLLSAFGLLALLLAAVGAYGLMAFFVEQRSREIGIRMALGADRGSVIRLVLRRGVALAVGGIVAGGAAAIATSRFLSSLVYEVPPDDPITLVAAASLLVVVAIAACLLPARRAASTDPVVALRAD